ncbi:LemA family protein [Mycobacteroides abscessus subsp. massiliense]|uniref:LemA family protein n=1 Tax=Mycobacteroides abscessus TaxID=36809 RepID=UPI0005DB6792|nr:LemA family protein [Mycobacteroides abscessus]AMU77716.1 LemA family protein [Mycobacteroides abscessus]ANO26663.1 LemA family protein [Mycobacteroides abscessus]MBN7316321.1 LemA family protein [Mycobacteroides abscessus subsp. massiliense]CPU39915.1 LemA family protein [Mycobacteroides abscessus]CPX60006.1 LemA family protein [Mycobacteroides abscessus]
MLVTVIVVVVLALLGGFVVVGFNRLRRQNVGVNEALGGIDVQLTRRADLIPNLVNTVKGYTQHERGVLENVTAARTEVQKAAQNGTVDEKAAAQAKLDKAIVDVLAVAEAYPDLKASANFTQLQQALTDTENQLSFARQYYNDAAATLNTSIATIPWMFLSALAGVKQRDFYQAPAGNEKPPTITF